LSRIGGEERAVLSECVLSLSDRDGDFRVCIDDGREARFAVVHRFGKSGFADALVDLVVRFRASEDGAILLIRDVDSGQHGEKKFRWKPREEPEVNSPWQRFRERRKLVDIRLEREGRP